ncbi:MAG: hypothetical protein QW341_04920 [Candidatus Bathyarchaeia archaeon]
MLRKSIISSVVVAVFLAMIFLNDLSIVSATNPSIKVNVRAKAEGENLIVIGKVFLRGLDSEVSTVCVEITITARSPDDSTEKRRMEVSGEICSNGVTVLQFEHKFEGFVKEKGIYEVEVTAKCGELSDTAFFKFDPPTGGTPGVPC